MVSSITIEVPDDVRILLERNPMLKKKFEKLAVEVFHEKLLRLAVADELTRDVEVSEETIEEFDRKIKRKIIKRLKDLA